MDIEYTSTLPFAEEAMNIDDDANKENVENRLLIPADSDLTSTAGDPSRKRLRPQPLPIVRNRKTAITAHKKKHKPSQLLNITHQQNIPPPPNDIQSTLQVQHQEAVVLLASLPPSKLCRKINSLENKLVQATKRKEDVEKKYMDKELECITIRQELRREKKAGNMLINEEKQKVAAACKEAQSAKEEVQSTKEETESTVETILEEMTKLKLECSEKIRNERQYWNREKGELIAKHAKDRSQQALIVAKLKEMHGKELEILNLRFAKELQKQKSLLEKEVDCVNEAMDKLAKVDECHDVILRDVRASQREMLKKAYDENEQLRNDIRDLNEMMDELCDKHTAAMKQAKLSNKAADKANDGAQRQRSKMNDILARLTELEHELADESHLRYEYEIQLKIESAPTGHEIKRESRVGLRGGSGKWSARVVLLICELLVDGVAPTAIKKTLQSTSAYFRGEEAKELPQESFIRDCRPVVQTMNTILVAYVLSNSPSWNQLLTDGTTRRQTAMQNLIIRFKKKDGVMDRVIVSSCIYAEDETSERVSAAVMDMVREDICCVMLPMCRLLNPLLLAPSSAHCIL